MCIMSIDSLLFYYGSVMKILFSCTTFQFEKYRMYYFAIRDYIVTSGHVLTHDWMNKLRSASLPSIPKITEQEYRKVYKGVVEADALIFESTLPSFSTGHLLTLGLQMKKPVLVLWLDSSPWVYRKGFIESIHEKDLQLASYSMDTLQSKLSEFFKKYQSYKSKHRFNLVIDDVERQYLEWLNYQTFHTKTRIIRELIRKKLEHDEAYRQYLSRGS